MLTCVACTSVPPRSCALVTSQLCALMMSRLCALVTSHSSYSPGIIIFGASGVQIASNYFEKNCMPSTPSRWTNVYMRRVSCERHPPARSPPRVLERMLVVHSIIPVMDGWVGAGAATSPVSSGETVPCCLQADMRATLTMTLSLPDLLTGLTTAPPL